MSKWPEGQKWDVAVGPLRKVEVKKGVVWFLGYAGSLNLHQPYCVVGLPALSWSLGKYEFTPPLSA